MFTVLIISIVLAQPEPSDSPWLPRQEQHRLQSLWPNTVPFPANMKFYKLQTASQVLAKVGKEFSSAPALEYRAFHTNKFDPETGKQYTSTQYPWAVSGGMDFVPLENWKNVTGLAIPPGKAIEVWTEFTTVENGSINSDGSPGRQQERQLSWAFPQGTIAVDLLINTKTGRVFEVRMREKTEPDKWDDGVAYRPTIPKGESRLYRVRDSRLLKTIGLTSIDYKWQEVGQQPDREYEFRPTNTVVTDGIVVPKGYVGTGVSCSKCHVAGTEPALYNGPILRRKDSVFSWYPILVSSVNRKDYIPEIDYRWPVVVRPR